MSRNAGLSGPGLEDVLTLLAAGAAAQQQANAQNAGQGGQADGSPFTAPFGLLGGALTAGTGLDLQSLLALQSQYSLPLLMSSAHANGGAAGPLPLPANLALPSVPSSELPKLLSLDLAALQQQADKKQQPADAAANNAAAALLMSRQGSDRGGPSRQADGAGPSSSRMRRAARGRGSMDSDDVSDEDRSSLTEEEDAPSEAQGKKGGKRGKAAPNSKEAVVKAQQRALKKRDLNREAQRRFRDRQKAALAILEDNNRAQQQEIQRLSVTQKLLEEQYRLLLEQYKAAQLKILSMQMKPNSPKEQ